MLRVPHRPPGEHLHLLPIALVGLVHVLQQALHRVGGRRLPTAPPRGKLHAGWPLQQPAHQTMLDLGY